MDTMSIAFLVRASITQRSQGSQKSNRGLVNEVHSDNEGQRGRFDEWSNWYVFVFLESKLSGG